jgi:1,4-dihydroxy-2-naphthoyl-CoA hydrolase
MNFCPNAGSHLNYLSFTWFVAGLVDPVKTQNPANRTGFCSRYFIYSKQLNKHKAPNMSKGNLGETLGIEFCEIGPDYLKARMPVRDGNKQPFGLLHGGASVALAETVASVAAFLAVHHLPGAIAVGLEINANHLKSVTQGYVTATCRPLQLGNRISVWDVRIHNEAGTLTCICRMTAAISEKRKNKE